PDDGLVELVLGEDGGLEEERDAVAAVGGRLLGVEEVAERARPVAAAARERDEVEERGAEERLGLEGAAPAALGARRARAARGGGGGEAGVEERGGPVPELGGARAVDERGVLLDDGEGAVPGLDALVEPPERAKARLVVGLEVDGAHIGVDGAVRIGELLDEEL